MATRSQTHRARSARGQRTPLSGRPTVRWAVVLLAGGASVLLAFPSRAATGFTPAGGSPYATSSGPNAVAAGDVNGDGTVDLASADIDTSTVTVMLGDGAADPAFPTTGQFTVGEYPYALVMDDFNRDGKPDLATANYDGIISVLLGDSHGSFAEPPASPVPVGGNPYGMTSGDFNGDGHADLATVDGSTSDVRVLLGDGAGGFAPAPGSPFEAGAGGSSRVVSGDLNGDTKLDLVIPYPGAGQVWILLGDGAGGFTAAPPVPTGDGSRPYAVAIADVNADTKPDLVTTDSRSGTISVFLGDGAAQPTFAATPASPISTGGSTPTDIAIDDIDGDGKVDAVVANQDSNNVALLIGDGAGRFAPMAGSPFDTGGTISYSLAVADMNGDARIDLVTGNYGSSNVSVLLNDLATEPPTTTTTEPSTTTTTEPPAATEPGATTTTTGPPATTEPGPTTTTMPPATTTTTGPAAGGRGDSGTKAQPASPTAGPAGSDRGASATGGATATPPRPGAGLPRTGSDVRRIADLGTALLSLGVLLRMRRRPTRNQ